MDTELNTDVDINLHAGASRDESDDLLRRLQQFGEKPGLARINYLLDGLGRPQDSIAAIHVAGTNGKGSTAAMIGSVLQAAGLRTGLFTSPHLLRYNERIVVDGAPISDERLQRLLQSVEPHITAAAATPSVGQPTEFEVATAVALAYFAAENVDVAVIEVGLGGRYDSTNVVRSAVSIITPVDLDHTNVLGTSLSAIAAEKAGIVQPGVPVVMGRQQPDAARVIREQAATLAAPLYEPDAHFEGRLTDINVHRTTCDLRWHHQWWRDVRLPLIGPHQVDNAAVAVAAVKLFVEGAPAAIREKFRPATGLTNLQDNADNIVDDAIRIGLGRVGWPGRFEVMGAAPLTILDGAHNVRSADALATTLVTVLPGERIVFVLGMLAEKPAEQILHSLLPLARAAIFTTPSQGRTAPADPERLATIAHGLVEDIYVEPEVPVAVARARELAGADGVVVICGSLYLVGEVKALPAGERQTTRE